MFDDLINALGFLSRLAPAKAVDGQSLGRTLVWFPAVGLILGLVAVLPLALGLAAGHPLVQALIFTVLCLYLTRGLHHDGLADIADGWGSLARGERFWEILKDSRIGAFGVMGLCLALIAQVVLAEAVFRAGAYGVAVCALVCGRASALVLAGVGRSLARPGLARDFLAAAGPGVVWLGLAQAVLIALVLTPLSAILAASAVCALILWRLYALAKLQGGVNGDFLGAAIVLGELGFFAGWLMTA